MKRNKFTPLKVACPKCKAGIGSQCWMIERYKVKRAYPLFCWERFLLYRSLPETKAREAALVLRSCGREKKKIKPKPIKSWGNNVQPGLRAKCISGNHLQCFASKCSCECHKLIVLKNERPNREAGP